MPETRRMMNDDGEIAEELEKPYRFWIWSMASVIFRFFLILFPENINLSSRPEVSTPLTSLRHRTASISLSLSLSFSLHHLQLRLQFSVCFECSVAEGYWLKQSSMSPYAGFGIVSYIWNLNSKIVVVENRICFFWAGSMYHGSPLLLSILGPLTIQR